MSFPHACCCYLGVRCFYYYCVHTNSCWCWRFVCNNLCWWARYSCCFSFCLLFLMLNDIRSFSNTAAHLNLFVPNRPIIPFLIWQSLYVYDFHFCPGLPVFCILYTTSFNRLTILYGPSQLVCNLGHNPFFSLGCRIIPAALHGNPPCLLHDHTWLLSCHRPSPSF